MIQPAEREALRPVTQAVLADLRNSAAHEEDRAHKLVVLAASVCVFVAFEWVHASFWSVIAVLAVLLLHEFGHYVAMRVLHYQNRRIYFIPVYGGESGCQDLHAPSSHRVIVALFGPLPGILLGLATAALFRSQAAKQFAEMVILINVFNLLPFVPLDGGHIWDQLLFCRSRYLETGFLLFGMLFLCALALGRGEWLLAVLGALMGWKAWYAWRVNAISDAFKASGARAAFEDFSRTHEEDLLPLVAAVRQRFPKAREPKQISARIRDVLGALFAEPPSDKKLWLFGGVYFASIALAAIGLDQAHS